MNRRKFTESGNQILTKVANCLYRSKASGQYYAIFKRSGRQIKRSLKTTDKELARRFLEDIRQKVVRLNSKTGEDLVLATFNPEDHSLDGGLAKRWLDAIGSRLKPRSRGRRETAIRTFSRYFPNTIRSISKNQIETWAAERMQIVTPRTFNIDRETLIQILDYAVREGLILENPARVLPRRKQPRPHIVIPTKTEFGAMIGEMRRDPRAIEAVNLCEFLAYSGCRLTEAINVLWGDIDFETDSFTVTGGEQLTKNLEARTAPLFAPLRRLLLAIRESLTRPPSRTDKILQIGSAKKSMASACKRQGLPHFSHHSLRHFFCSNAIEAGVDFKAIAGWVGHKDGGVLVAKTYGHLRDEHSAAMAKRLTFDLNAEPPTPHTPSKDSFRLDI